MSGFQYSQADGGAGGGNEGGGSGEPTGAMALATRYLPSADTLKDSFLGVFSKTQPWGEFFNTKQFAMPQPSEVPDRVKENVQHYAFNYLVILLLLSFFFVLTKPLSLISVVIVGLGYYVLFMASPDTPVKIGPLELDTSVKKGSVLAVGGIILFWITGAVATLMSLVGTVAILGGVHALMRKPASEPDFESGFTA